MRVPDYISGLIILAVAAAAVIMALDFPSAIGQPLGPAVFPIIIASGLALCAVILIGSSVRRRFAGQRPAADAGGTGMRIDARSAGIMALMVAMPILYVIAVEPLGFLLTSVVVLLGSALVLWGGLVRSSLFALGCAVAIDAVFRGIFGIPLSNGLVHIPWW